VGVEEGGEAFADLGLVETVDAVRVGGAGGGGGFEEAPEIDGEIVVAGAEVAAARMWASSRASSARSGSKAPVMTVQPGGTAWGSAILVRVSTRI
jgi:hypothetical protein